ncbi:MAG: hypothetical protein JW803_01590 [Endomicrobiales bacterium]|nr:hypothetical protein [Endomicrobiales bacterium]
MVIKSVLREELKNSLRIKRNYEKELKKLPEGSLLKKQIKGYSYYYLVSRNNGKVKFAYKGKTISPKLADKYKNAKTLRAKYRSLLSSVKKQIKFLRGALRGRESI